MGTAATGRLDDRSLFGRTRTALLAMLFGHADESFYLRQIVRALGAGHGGVQRELKRLLDLDLIIRRKQGNQVLYQANVHSPIFPEIKSLLTKTAGVHDVIRSALVPIATRVQVAFVYGSVARQTEHATSDVDLMIVGEVSFEEVVSELSAAQRLLAREINPTIYSASEFRTKLRAGNHFLRSVMGQKKLFVVGTEHELADLAAK